MADLTVVGNGEKKNGAPKGTKLVAKVSKVQMTKPPEDVEHVEVRQRVLDLRRKTEESYWELSIGLHEVYEGSHYIAWGYTSWKEYVSQELEFQPRKAQYLVQIQEWFGKMKPAVQGWIRSLGWTKAKELVGKVNNENYTDWKRKLDGKSYKQMMDILEPPEDAPAPQLSPGGRAPADDGTDNFTRLSFQLAPAQLQNVHDALNKAQQMAESDKPGNALDLICTDFISGNAGIDNQSEYLRGVEAQLPGIKLIAIDTNAPGDDVTLVYGAENLDQFSGSED